MILTVVLEARIARVNRIRNAILNGHTQYKKVLEDAEGVLIRHLNAIGDR